MVSKMTNVYAGNQQRSSTHCINFCEWKVEDTRASRGPKPWCVLEEDTVQDLLPEDLLDAISANPRLKALRGKPKNQIVELPEASTLARQFHCAACKGIPFPWAPDPTPNTNMEYPIRQDVFLCEEGHLICRTCIQVYGTCLYSLDDYMYMFGNTLDHSDPSHFLSHISQVPESMGVWGQTLLCNADVDVEMITDSSQFAASMINCTEFACPYYYNWCGFRGRGKQLRDHKKLCNCNPEFHAISQ